MELKIILIREVYQSSMQTCLKYLKFHMLMIL